MKIKRLRKEIEEVLITLLPGGKPHRRRFPHGGRRFPLLGRERERSPGAFHQSARARRDPRDAHQGRQQPLPRDHHHHQFRRDAP